MSYTSHGHHIPGTPEDNPPTQRARCGGVTHCQVCKGEAAWGRMNDWMFGQPTEFHGKATLAVVNFIEKRTPTYRPKETYDVKIVSFSAGLRGDWWAIVTSTLYRDVYYRVVYDASKRETLVESYIWNESETLPDPD